MEEKSGERKKKKGIKKPNNELDKKNPNPGRIFTPGSDSARLASSSPTHAKVTRESFCKMSYDKMRTRTLVKERLGVHWRYFLIGE